MDFSQAMDFYENKGVIYDIDNEKFYSIKGMPLKEAEYENYKKSEWKLVAMEQFDFFSAFEISYLKELFNGEKEFIYEYVPSLKKLMCKIEDAFWRKDDKDIVSCLRDILVLIEPYPNL